MWPRLWRSQPPSSGSFRWRHAQISLISYFERTERKKWAPATWLRYNGTFFLTAEMGSRHFFSLHELGGCWKFGVFFFSSSSLSSMRRSRRVARPTMREEATPTSRLVFSCSRADVVFWVPSVQFRCWRSHFRYAKSNLLVSRRAAVGARPR